MKHRDAKRRQVGTKIPDHMYERLVEVAAERGTTIAYLLREHVRHLTRQPSRPRPKRVRPTWAFVSAQLDRIEKAISAQDGRIGSGEGKESDPRARARLRASSSILENRGETFEALAHR